MKVLGIIPARYASTRFPGKPLAPICGKPMIEWVYKNASKSALLDDLIIATDDERIETTVQSFGGQVMMTNPDHLSGTDRCAEVVQQLDGEKTYDIVINIQGDEPLIEAADIDQLINLLKREDVQIGTLIYPTENRADINNTNRVKVLFKNDGKAFRFARQLPEVRLKLPFYLHRGMYGFKTSTLLEITQLKPSKNELKEKLEQLRWLDNGYAIHLAKVKTAGIGVDVPEDVQIVEALMAS